MRLGLKAALLTIIPLVLMTAIGVALLAQGKADDGRSTLAVGVIVAAVSGATTIYSVNRWSFRRQSLVHLAVMAVTVLPALLLSGWFPLHTFWNYLAVIGVFLLVGLVIWTLMSLVFMRQIRARRDA